jgi:ABC-type branched-subunit amino acid transport system ATPase component
MLLEVEGLCVNYGHIEAIRDITFGVEEGTIATLIGANGAGKTTTLKTLSGLRKVRAGKVMFDGKDITTDDELRSAILARKPGDQVTVVVVRANGSRTTLTATLGVRPVNP